VVKRCNYNKQVSLDVDSVERHKRSMRDHDLVDISPWAINPDARVDCENIEKKPAHLFEGPLCD
jgi:hypothetical protein